VAAAKRSPRNPFSAPVAPTYPANRVSAHSSRCMFSAEGLPVSKAWLPGSSIGYRSGSSGSDSKVSWPNARASASRCSGRNAYGEIASEIAAGVLRMASSPSVSDMPTPDSSRPTRGRVSLASKCAA
jgi:hypothetical protein